MPDFLSPPNFPHFRGLNSDEVAYLRFRHGSNLDSQVGNETWWRLLSARFHDPVIKLLLFAAFISAVVGWYKSEYLEFIGILVTLLLTIAAGFFSELKAHHEFTQVSKVIEAFPSRVMRDNLMTTIPLGDIVVGDVILLDPGDEVPADGRLLSVDGPPLTVDESALSGNPIPMTKFLGRSTEPIPTMGCMPPKSHGWRKSWGAIVGKYPHNLLLQGMIILSGHAVMEAKAVGKATEKGRNFGQLSGKESPLERDLEKLGSGIGLIGLSAASIAFTISLARGLSSGDISLHSSEWMLLLISLISLLAGGLEIWIPFLYGSLELAGFEVTQRGLIPASGWQNWIRGSARFALTFSFLTILAMVADLVPGSPELWLRTASIQQLFRYLMFSLAIIIVAIPDGLGMSVTLSIAFSMKKMVKDKTLVRHPYASETIGAVTTIMTDFNGPITSGAVAECRQAGIELKLVTSMEASVAQKLAQDLGLIEPTGRELPGLSPRWGVCRQKAMDGVCLWRLSPRRGVCRQKAMDGVRLWRLSPRWGACPPKAMDGECLGGLSSADGAHAPRNRSGPMVLRPKKRAQEPCARNRPDGEAFSGLSQQPLMHITAGDFLQIRHQEAAEAAKKLKLLSEATPDARQRFFQLLAEQGQRIGVVGGHPSDIVLLKKADVGVSLGQGSSTAVVDAGDILLLDNSLSALMSAVKWGRSLYENIQRFLVFQLTINVFAVFVEILGPAIGVELPLTVAQMLWVNLIMDILAAMALATEPPRPGILKQPPRRTDSFIITPRMLWDITTTSLLFLICAAAVLISLASDGIVSREDLTFFFTVFVLLQLWNLFNARCYGRNVSVFNNLHRNPEFLMVAFLVLLGQFLIVQFGGALFQTVPLTFTDWWHIILATTPVLLIHEIRRFWNEERRQRPYDSID